jgi:2-iminobutanoate/2-iminopropanoate deaminase
MFVKKTIIEPSWEAKYSFSPAVVTEGGKTIWLAGHVGFVDDAGASLAGNFDAQVRQAFKNLEKTLRRAGGTLKDIVWMTVAVSDGRYSQRFTDIRKEIYGSNSRQHATDGGELCGTGHHGGDHADRGRRRIAKTRRRTRLSGRALPLLGDRVTHDDLARRKLVAAKIRATPRGSALSSRPAGDDVAAVVAL